METAASIAQLLLDPMRRTPPMDVIRQDAAGDPGLYARFVDDGGAADLAAGLGLTVGRGLLYAGQAGATPSRATLTSRVMQNHIGGNTYASTLRLTLASVLRKQLRLTPTGRRRMDASGEPRLTIWMTSHLQIAIAAYPDREALHNAEAEVIGLLDPPFNLGGCSPTDARRALSRLRHAFVHLEAASPVRPVTSTPPPMTRAPSGSGLTPEELARDLGLPDAKRVRGFLRREFPRPASELWSRWGPLTPEMESAVRRRFG